MVVIVTEYIMHCLWLHKVTSLLRETERVYDGLFNSKNAIRSEHKPELMNELKHAMYSGIEGDADKAFNDLIEYSNELSTETSSSW